MNTCPNIFAHIFLAFFFREKPLADVVCVIDNFLSGGPICQRLLQFSHQQLALSAHPRVILQLRNSFRELRSSPQEFRALQRSATALKIQNIFNSKHGRKTKLSVISE